MATSYLDIYTRAMSQIKSPTLSRLQSNDLQTFCIIMNQYLQTAITLYNPNAETSRRISAQTESTYSDNSFVGDDVTTVFNLAGTALLLNTSIFKVLVNDEVITDYTIDYVNSTIVFSIAPASGSEIEVSWYNVGSFDGTLLPHDITLLTWALCWAWAVQIENNQLDIDRSLSDTDFKQHSEGQTQNAKVSWVKYFEEMYHRELSKTDWRSLFRQK